MNNQFMGYGYLDNSYMMPIYQTNMVNNSNINNNIRNSENKELEQPYEGFIRGNMFSNLYNEYKNYKITRLIPNTEQAELLLNVDQIAFSCNDIKLYLDIYPNDTNMINIYNSYCQILDEAIKNYENKYGPILANTVSNDNIFSWENDTWPWEMEEN